MASRKTTSKRSRNSRWLSAMPHKKRSRCAAECVWSNSERRRGRHTHRWASSQASVASAGSVTSSPFAVTQPASWSASTAAYPRRDNSRASVVLPEPGLPVTRNAATAPLHLVLRPRTDLSSGNLRRVVVVRAGWLHVWGRLPALAGARDSFNRAGDRTPLRRRMPHFTPTVPYQCDDGPHRHSTCRGRQGSGHSGPSVTALLHHLDADDCRSTGPIREGQAVGRDVQCQPHVVGALRSLSARVSAISSEATRGRRPRPLGRCGRSAASRRRSPRGVRVRGPRRGTREVGDELGLATACPGAGRRRRRPVVHAPPRGRGTPTRRRGVRASISGRRSPVESDREMAVVDELLDHMAFSDHSEPEAGADRDDAEGRVHASGSEPQLLAVSDVASLLTTRGPRAAASGPARSSSSQPTVLMVFVTDTWAPTRSGNDASPLTTTSPNMLQSTPYARSEVNLIPTTCRALGTADSSFVGRRYPSSGPG